MIFELSFVVPASTCMFPLSLSCFVQFNFFSVLSSLFYRQDIYMNLLALSFNSLSWRDTGNCQRAATLICWTLLRQVPKKAITLPRTPDLRKYMWFCWCFSQVVGANLLPDAVTWLFTRVLSGLQMHGQHDGCNAVLTQLALLIYDALVCFTFGT